MGDEPDKPSVEIDIRRRWSCAAAVAIGPLGPPDVLFDRPKMLLKVWVVKEPRRALVAASGEGLSLLLAMLADWFGWGSRAFEITAVIVRLYFVVLRDSFGYPWLLSSALGTRMTWAARRC